MTRVGKVPVIPCFAPGSPGIVPHITSQASDDPALLIAAQGPVAASATREAAVFAMEELEYMEELKYTARLVHFEQRIALDVSFQQVVHLGAPSETEVATRQQRQEPPDEHA